MAKKDRVYTKRMAGGFTLGDGVSGPSTLVDTWVAQEDHKIIGWDLEVGPSFSNSGQPTADGAWDTELALSFAAQSHTDAEFAQVAIGALREVFGSPASGAGWINHVQRRVTMLPAGKYIEMKEGEQINMFVDGHNYSGVAYSLGGDAIIYYTKD